MIKKRNTREKEKKEKKKEGKTDILTKLFQQHRDKITVVIVISMVSIKLVHVESMLNPSL